LNYSDAEWYVYHEPQIIGIALVFAKTLIENIPKMCHKSIHPLKTTLRFFAMNISQLVSIKYKRKKHEQL